MSDREALARFRKWAVDIGHYHVVGGVDRYITMLDSLGAKQELADRCGCNQQDCWRCNFDTDDKEETGHGTG